MNPFFILLLLCATKLVAAINSTLNATQLSNHSCEIYSQKHLKTEYLSQNSLRCIRFHVVCYHFEGDAYPEYYTLDENPMPLGLHYCCTRLEIYVRGMRILDDDINHLSQYNCHHYSPYKNDWSLLTILVHEDLVHENHEHDLTLNMLVDYDRDALKNLIVLSMHNKDPFVFTTNTYTLTDTFAIKRIVFEDK